MCLIQYFSFISLIDEIHQFKLEERPISSNSAYHALGMQFPSSFSLKSSPFSSFESPKPSPAHESRKTEFRYSRDKHQGFEYESNESYSSTNVYFSLKSSPFSSFESPEPSPGHESRKTGFRYSRDKHQGFEYESNESYSSTNVYGNRSSYTVSGKGNVKPLPGECNFISEIKC